MRKVFVAFKIEGGKLVAHDHPVLTGEIAYDLGQEQELFVHPDHGVREFTSESEAYAAIADYMREHVGEETEREAITPFVLLPVITVDVPQARAPRVRSVKGVQKSSTKTK